MNEKEGLNKGENSLTSENFEEKIGIWEFIKETVRFTFLSLLIVAPIRIFVAQPFLVSGNSMVPTFSNNDYLIVDQLSYYFNEPKRGEVIIFRYPQDTTKFFVKRIVGLPNEIVKIENGRVSIASKKSPENFVSIDEFYVKKKDLRNSDVKFILGNDEYFVMGDNRTASSDSREWGPLKEKLITGRALLRLFPIAHVEFLPGDYANVFSSMKKLNFQK